MTAQQICKQVLIHFYKLLRKCTNSPLEINKTAVVEEMYRQEKCQYK